jgi:hypothetical protein
MLEPPSLWHLIMAPLINKLIQMSKHFRKKMLNVYNNQPTEKQDNLKAINANNAKQFYVFLVKVYLT